LANNEESIMDEVDTVDAKKGKPVPEPLRGLFDHPDDVRVLKLPCKLPDKSSMAVFFSAGARTVAHPAGPADAGLNITDYYVFHGQ
jgi:hypothetical protein